MDGEIFSSDDPDKKLALVIKQIDQEFIQKDDNATNPFEGVRRQDLFIGNLVDILTEDYNLRISPETADRRVRNTIEEMLTEAESTRTGYDDPVSRFRSNWPELSDGASFPDYLVLIPLPLQVEPNALPDTVDYGKNVIERISPDTWRNYRDLANNLTPIESGTYPTSPEEYLEATGIGSLSTGEYTFWKFEVSGGDADYAIRELESVLDVFLGKLNYATNEYHQLEFDATRNMVRRAGRTVIEKPPMYLLFQEGEFHRLQPKNTDLSSPIPSVRPVDRYDIAIAPFPSLTSLNLPDSLAFEADSSILNSSLEAQLGASFRTLGGALTTTDPETAFLSFYRTLEHVTFSRKVASIEPLQRALRLVDAREDHYLNSFVSNIKNRRNDLVHEGTDVGITVGDLNFLKGLCITAMQTLGQVADEYSREEILTYIVTEDVESKIQKLETEIESLEEELERYEGVMDWE